MNSSQSNPSRIRHNPSRGVTDSATKQASHAVCDDFLMKSVTNPSRVPVTDFGRGKPLKYKEKLSLTMCKYESVTRCRARRFHVRAGVVTDSRDGFEFVRSRLGAITACGRHVWPTFASSREFRRWSASPAPRDTRPTCGPRPACQSGRAIGTPPAKSVRRRPREQSRD
jgi:hypothetical protein